MTIGTRLNCDTYLHFGPSQITSLSQKLVFKAKISGEGGPVGVSRGQAPLESEVFYYLKGFLEVLVLKQLQILNLPSCLFVVFRFDFFWRPTRHVKCL